MDAAEMGRIIVEECKDLEPPKEKLQTDHEDLDKRFHKALSRLEMLAATPADKLVRMERLIDRLRACKRALHTPQRIYAIYLNFKHNAALCPFHDEKTPSFRIFKDGGYYCFGCQAHGDIFDFIRHKEACSLTRAIEIVEANI